MKLLISLATCLLAIAAFAGPEEHLQDQSCYTLVRTSGQYVPQEVPEQICLESLNIDTTRETIVVYSYFQSSLFKTMTVSSLTRKNEDFYSFQATGTLKDETFYGCGGSEKIDLLIHGLVDNYGQGDINTLQVAVHYEYTNDTCHNPLREEDYKYQLR